MSETTNTTPANTAETNTEVLETNLDSTENEVVETTEESSETKPVETKEEKKQKEQLKKNLKKLKLKVDGKEIEEEIDLDDEAALTRHLQLSKAAQKRMAEHATLQKNLEAFFEALKEDPISVLSDPAIGLDIKQLAAQVVEREVEQSKKSPEQIEKEKLLKELEEKDKILKQKEEEFKQQELARLTEQSVQEYDAQINSALEKSSLPKTAYTLKKMVDVMLFALDQGVKITAEDAVDLVKNDVHNDLKEMFKVLPDETIEAIVGKDTLNRVRKSAVAKAKTVVPNTKVADTGKTTENSEPAKKKTIKELFGV